MYIQRHCLLAIAIGIDLLLIYNILSILLLPSPCMTLSCNRRGGLVEKVKKKKAYIRLRIEMNANNWQ